MATFTYTAKREKGNPFTGELVADDKAAVVADLRRKGFTILKVEEKRGGMPDINAMLENSQRIKTRDKAVFARQFATMINSGLAVLRALYILEEQTENKRFKKIIGSVREGVEAGMPLSDAMERYPVAFDRLYVSMVRAAKQAAPSTRLSSVSPRSSKRRQSEAAIKSAMMYRSSCWSSPSVSRWVC